MRYVDSLAVDPATMWARSRIWIPPHLYIDDHFPGNPVVPGNWIKEAMGHVAAAFLLSVARLNGCDKLFAGDCLVNLRRDKTEYGNLAPIGELLSCHASYIPPSAKSDDNRSELSVGLVCSHAGIPLIWGTITGLVVSLQRPTRPIQLHKFLTQPAQSVVSLIPARDVEFARDVQYLIEFLRRRLIAQRRWGTDP